MWPVTVAMLHQALRFRDEMKAKNIVSFSMACRTINIHNLVPAIPDSVINAINYIPGIKRKLSIDNILFVQLRVCPYCMCVCVVLRGYASRL